MTPKYQTGGVFSFFTFGFLMICTSASSAEGLDAVFLGRWVALSKACIAGSQLVIDGESFSQAGESPIHFKINEGANSKQAWLQDKKAHTDSKFYRLKIESSGELKFTYADQINTSESEDGYSSCWYKRASASIPDKALKQSSFPKK